MPSPGYIAGPLVIPLTWQIRLIWFLPNGVLASNVLHAIVDVDTSPTVGIANAIHEAISLDPDWVDYAQNLAPTTALQRVDIRDLRAPFQPLFESDFDALPGTGVGNALPESVALCATLRTELSGRAHRGRAYLTGFDDSTLDANGHATGTLTANARDFMMSIKAIFTAQGLSLGVAHRGHAEYVNAKGVTVPAEEPGTDRVVSAVIRDNIFDSQRRRK